MGNGRTQSLAHYVSVVLRYRSPQSQGALQLRADGRHVLVRKAAPTQPVQAQALGSQIEPLRVADQTTPTPPHPGSLQANPPRLVNSNQTRHETRAARRASNGWGDAGRIAAKLFTKVVISDWEGRCAHRRNGRPSCICTARNCLQRRRGCTRIHVGQRAPKSGDCNPARHSGSRSRCCTGPGPSPCRGTHDAGALPPCDIDAPPKKSA